MKSLAIATLFWVSAFAWADDLPADHPTIKDALEAAGATSAEAAAQLPNRGTVVNTLHSRGYTYIQVEHEGENIWLAAPQVELTNGSVIRYGQGIGMVNFYSNGLEREFAEILFVDRVQSVQD
jgi:hypothetical protein